MKQAIKIAILTMAIMAATSTNGQVKHGTWQGHLEYGSNALLTRDGVVTIDNFFSGKWGKESFYARWISPAIGLNFHTPNWKMSDSSGQIPLKGPYWWRCLLIGDFDHDYNTSIGYTISYRSFDIPIGINVGVDYEWMGICVTDGYLKGLHRTSSLIPHAGLTLRPLGISHELSKNWSLLLDGNISYVKNMTYNNPVNLDGNVINNGLRASVGRGVRLGYLTLGQLYYSSLYYTICYEWNCFEYFNIPGVDARLGSLKIRAGFMF